MPSLSDLSSKLDAVLQHWTESQHDAEKLPFIIAGAADKTQLKYLGSAGLKDSNDQSSGVSNDTRVALYSTSKAVTVTLLFQLIERGVIGSIDDPVEKYVSDIKNIKLLKGFDDNDKPILDDVKTKVTLKHLVTHTAGFAYAFFDPLYAKLQDQTGNPNILKADWEHFKTPLVFEPGTRWEYGSNIDWVGKVIMEASGMSLDDFVKKNICEPLQMKTFTYIRTSDQLDNQAKIHFRDLDTGKLKPSEELHPLDPLFQCGGHGLFGTVGDYLKFLQIFLNDGASPDGVQILKPETIRNYFFTDLLDGLTLETLPAAQPYLTNEVAFSPSDSWTALFAVTKKGLATGRSANSFNWAGLPNLYYWIDPRKGCVGYFATQLFPFFDETALSAFLEFEKTFYDNV